MSASWSTLIAAREAAGVSRYRLAKDMHINLSHLGRLERGEVSPRAATVARAAEALNVPITDILPSSTTYPDGSPAGLTVEQVKELVRVGVAAELERRGFGKVPRRSGTVAVIAQDIVYQRIPYAWGGGGIHGPSQGMSDGGGWADRNGDYTKVGFDDASLAQYLLYQAFGTTIPRTAFEQREQGACVSIADLQPGDLVFPVPERGNVQHVSVYIGDWEIVDAPCPGKLIEIRELEGCTNFRRFHPPSPQVLPVVRSFCGLA